MAREKRRDGRNSKTSRVLLVENMLIDAKNVMYPISK
jgi:hypothetical protein